MSNCCAEKFKTQMCLKAGMWSQLLFIEASHAFMFSHALGHRNAAFMQIRLMFLTHRGQIATSHLGSDCGRSERFPQWSGHRSRGAQVKIVLVGLPDPNSKCHKEQPLGLAERIRWATSSHEGALRLLKKHERTPRGTGRVKAGHLLWSTNQATNPSRLLSFSRNAVWCSGVIVFDAG